MIRGVKFLGICVSDQDRALAFYTQKLGFTIQTDQPFEGGQRWIELGIPGANTGVVLLRRKAMRIGSVLSSTPRCGRTTSRRLTRSSRPRAWNSPRRP